MGWEVHLEAVMALKDDIQILDTQNRTLHNQKYLIGWGEYRAAL